MADEQKSAEATSKPEPSIRKKLQMARMDKVRKGRDVPRVRVVPRDDEMRELLKHPRAGKFRSSGSLEWPNDTFTQRRIRDGSVTLEAPRNGNGKQPPSRPSHA
jgi:hypothetical protein